MRTKKALIAVLCFLLMFTMMPMSIYADSPTVTVKVEAETTDVNQNDEVNFTIYLEDCSGLEASGGLFNLDFNLVIPTGLTLVANSAVVDTNFATNTGFTGPAFNPAEGVMKFSSFGALATGYSGGRIPVMTFKCKVDANAVGSKIVDVTNIVPTDISGKTDTFTAVNVPATINIAAPTTYINSVTASVDAPVSGSPLDTAASVDSSAGYTAASVTWYEGNTISDSAKVDTATSPNAKPETVYTAVIGLTAKSTEGYKFKTGSEITATDGYSIVSGGTETALSISKTFAETSKEGLEVSVDSLSETYGYTSPTSKTIVIKNIGTSTNIQVKSVEVSDTARFEIVGSSQPTINAGSIDNTSFKIKAKTGLNAGTYTATITVKDMDDNSYTATVLLNVARKPLGDISISQNGWMYGDSAPTYTTSGLDSLTTSQYKIEYSVKDANAWSATKPTKAGTYTIKVTVTDTNLEEKSASADFTIAKNNKEIQIIAASNQWTYDGNSHSDTSYTVKYNGTVATGGELPTGDTVTAVISGSVKDVKDTVTGNNVVQSYTIENEDCYSNVTRTNGTLTINKITRQITVTAGSIERGYDGNALTNNTFTHTEGVLLSGDTLTATVTGSQTFVGESDNTLSNVKVMRGDVDITSNYNLRTPMKGKLKVTPVDQPLTIADQTMTTNSTLLKSELEAALTGAKGNVSFAIKTGLTGAEYNVDLYGGLRAGNTAGTIVMTATAQAYDVNGDGTAEYNLTDKDFNVAVVNKEQVVIGGLTDNEVFTYDENAKTPSGTLTVTGNKVPVSELDVSYAGTGSTSYNSTNAPTNAGTYSVTYSVKASNASYAGTKTYYFTINKATLTKVTLSGEYLYDGTPKTAVLNGFDSATMTKSGSETRTEVGSQIITVSLKSGNYTWADGSTTDLSITFEVKKATPVITIDNLSQKVGSVTAPTYTIAPDKTDGTVKVEYKLSTAGDETYIETLPTEAGTYTVRVSITGDKNLKDTSNTATFQIKSKSSGGGSGSGSVSYTLTFDTNGGSSIAKVSAANGTEIKLNKYEPTRANYKFAGWYSDKKLENKVTSVKLTDNITVYAAWEKDNSAVLPFKDVKPSHWFYNDVKDAFNNGLMNGTSEDTFSPNEPITRGMIVTILYRLENEPAVLGKMPFNDVKAGSYYEKAIMWAAANGIVDGYGDGIFAPNDEITREQLATILWRYAQYKGYDVSKGADVAGYTDANAIHSYAKDAFEWTCGEGIINGTSETTLSPSGTATRAQAAATFNRLCNSVK